MKWLIEFRSGLYFQSLEAEHSGPAETAQEFATREEADEFMRTHEWILMHGGMSVPTEG